jgi:hypothetical protein
VGIVSPAEGDAMVLASHEAMVLGWSAA